MTRDVEGLCPLCGEAVLVRGRRQERFPFQYGGETVEVVADDVPVESCPACKENFTGHEAARIRHEAVCQAFGLLTPTRIRSIRERLGLSQEEFARLTGIGQASLSRWERGRLLHNRAADRSLRLLEDEPRLVENLRRLAGEGAAR